MKNALVACLSILPLALLPGGFAPAASAGEVVLGSHRVSYDDEVWHAERLVAGQLIRFTCFSADCPGDGVLLPDLYALARSTASGGWGGCDSAEASLLTSDTEYSSVSFGHPIVAGIEFQVTALASAWCRRRVPRQPPVIQACGVSQDTLYWLTTAFTGCSPEPNLPKVRFDEILQGFREGTAAAP